MENNIKFNQWFAGIIDGDGYFALSKKGYAALEITMDIRDAQCLYKIKNTFGGSIKLLGGAKALRYRLHNKAGILKVIAAVNGYIRNPIRLAQLYKICDLYGITLIYADTLTYDNAWLSGFIDSDGSIYYNIESVQIFITVSQKNKLLLDPLVSIYGGTIYSVKTTESFKWVILKKEEVITFLEYIKVCPLYSSKMKKIHLIPQIYDCFKNSFHRSEKTSIGGKIWKKYSDKWEAYEDL